MKVFTNILAVLFCFFLSSFPFMSYGQNVESNTIMIDASSTLPIGTGLTADNINDHFIIIAENTVRIPAHNSWIFTNGWFDSSGLDRLRRVGQYFADMPYGSLIGTFTTMPGGFYLGDGGTFEAQPVDIGNELKLGLNMDGTDHANLEGQIVAHVIKIPGAAAQHTTVVIDASTPFPVGTGLIADNTSDNFIILSEGAARIPSHNSWIYTNGWFDPSGLIRLRRVGQYHDDMPYGSLMGTFTTLTGGFYLGDGGTFDAQPVDVGNEFKLGINMSGVDHTNLEGQIVVHVIKVPGSAAQSTTVVIDASTPLPVGTGLTADNTQDHFIVMAENCIRIPSHNSWIYTNGWFDASGPARLRRAGQYFNDMPYGSLMGTFTTLPGGFYLGDGGAFDAQPVDVGKEFKLGLNMDGTDHANLEGQIVAHVIKIPGAMAQSSTVVIDALTSLPVSTGFTADNGDNRFIILDEGAIRIPSHNSWIYTNGWFDPSGPARLRRTGQYFQDMPYGSLMGTFSSLPGGFYLGDGGTFDAQPVDVVNEFKLGINMGSTDHTNLEGQIVTHIIKIPGTVTESISYEFVQEGWYLVSLPVMPVDSSVASLFPTALGGIAFDWNSATELYEMKSYMRPRKGYWLAIPGATSNEVVGLPLNSYTAHYPDQGWYMIGSVLGSVDFTNPDDTPDGSVLVPAFGWDTGSSTYYQTSTFNEKEAYWIAVMGACDLTVGGGTGQKANTLAKADWTGFAKNHSAMPPTPPNVNWETGELVLVPTEYGLSQNYPNPFNPETTIEYQLPEDGRITLIIYNMMGQEVRQLVDEEKRAGYYKVVWDGRSDSGSYVGSGVYLGRMSAGDKIFTMKILLVH